MTEINPTMSSQIIEVLDNLAQKFGIAIDWTNQNIAPYLTELMDKYVKYKAIFLIGIFIILFLITGLMIIISYKNIKKRGKNFDPDFFLRDFLSVVILISGIIGFVLVFIVFLCNLSDLVACFVFPEKIIFDYVSSFLN